MQEYIALKVKKVETTGIEDAKDANYFSSDPSKAFGYKVTFENGDTKWFPFRHIELDAKELVMDHNAIFISRKDHLKQFKTEETFKDRLKTEHFELKNKLEKLKIFMDTREVFDAIDLTEQEFLRKQCSYMESYLTILECRMEYLGIPIN